MEEMLIEYVRSNPVLYDPTNREYRNQQSRKEAWDEVGEKLGISGDECKENWNKLRNAYTQAKHRRATKSGQAAKSLSKWKFEDEMAFLNPTFITRKTRGNAEDSSNNEDDDGTREEIGLRPLEDTDSQVVASGSSQSNPPRNDLLQSAIPTMADVIGNPTANVSDCSTFAQPSSKPIRPYVGKKRLSSSVQEMVAIMKDNQHLHPQVLLQSAPSASSVPLHPSYNMDDECELFFLSMAKNVKKLRPDEQIRVKMEVSNIVLGAALQAACGRPFQEEGYHKTLNTNPSSSYHQYSSTPSPQQSEHSLDCSTDSTFSYTRQEKQQENVTDL